MPSYMSLERPHPAVWVLKLNSPPDNRLHPNLLNELNANLDVVEAEWRKSGGGLAQPEQRGKLNGAGALVITSDIPKFFSNGLHPTSLGDPTFFADTWDPISYRLLTFPLVTVAAINGHAFAAGFCLALCCDFRVMTNGKGMMCMNEVQFGAPLPPTFSQLLKDRLSPRALRDTLLAKRWTQAEALKEGIIDEIVNDQGDKAGAVLRRAIELGVEHGAKIGLGPWGSLKEGVNLNYLEANYSHRKVRHPAEAAKSFWDRIEQQRVKSAKFTHSKL